MRIVQIISGGYGYKTGKGTILKDRNSEPFELDDAEAERIVAFGIAEYVDTEVATPVPAEENETAGVNSTEA